MTIEAFIIAWNREDSIALTINHYKKFCSKITVYDNFSDDNTRDIAYSLGCEVELFGREGVLDDSEYKRIKNNCWKGSEADWVIVVDDDEILYHEDLSFILNQGRVNGVTLFKPQGFSIHSDQMPVSDWLEIQTGFTDNNYSKICVFNPSKVDIGYEYGCHTHMKDYPKGQINYGKDKLWLLHYRSVGGVNRLLERWRQYEPRRQRSQINMKWGLGKQYAQDEASIRKEWKESLEKSGPLSGVGFA